MIPCSKERGLILYKLSTLCSTGPTRTPARPQYPADYTQCRVRKQSNECESEKRLVKSQWLGVALIECGARGTLAVHAAASTARGRTTALPSRDYIGHIFSTESHVQNFRSVFEHAQSVRLHGKTHRLFCRAGARTESHQWGPGFLYA